jgi:hypothetical protein
MSVTSDINYGANSRFSRSHGRIEGGDSSRGMRYPSPFMDIAHTWLPTSIKSLLWLCRERGHALGRKDAQT